MTTEMEVSSNELNSETEEEEEGRDSVATNRYVKEMRKKLSSDDEMN
jgi:hypothetical protein